MHNLSGSIRTSTKEKLILVIGFILALSIGAIAVIFQNYAFALIPVVLLGIILSLVLIFRDPFVGLVLSICYCFLLFIPTREIGGSIPYGIGIEIILIITLLSIWYNAREFDFKILNNDLIWLSLGWFIISLLELVNPAGASPRGWLQEVRTAAIYPLIMSFIGVLLINSRKKLDIILKLMIFLSLLASLNGIKQLKIGLFPGEQRFLDDVGNLTHMINGQLRVFSFYSDAAKFGPSQAAMFIMCIILAVGLKGWMKKLVLVAIGLISFYGMMVSGTRGAFFVIIIGIVVGLLLSKSLKTIVFGGAISAFFFAILKYTYIGNTNYNIYRLRSALDTEDASLNIRLINQEKIRDYLATRPFGGGLGVIGTWGTEYNPGNYLASIAPDSYWVKVWAMYGIVGFIIFFCIWMYWIGKCGGMIWNIKDKSLRTKLIALLASTAGLFVCSYGNEVMNGVPSIAVVYFSLAAIYSMHYLYKKDPNFHKV